MRFARIVAIIGLVFLGFSGIAGVIPLLLHPAGEPWMMPQSLLRHTPFHSYLIPGIILLLANGLLVSGPGFLPHQQEGSELEPQPQPQSPRLNEFSS